MDGLGLCGFEAGLKASPFPGPTRIKVPGCSQAGVGRGQPGRSH